MNKLFILSFALDLIINAGLAPCHRLISSPIMYHQMLLCDIFSKSLQTLIVNTFLSSYFYQKLIDKWEDVTNQYQQNIHVSSLVRYHNVFTFIFHSFLASSLLIMVRIIIHIKTFHFIGFS